MLICATTGRVVGRGQRLRVLTRDGFTEGILDSVAISGAVRVRTGTHIDEVRLDEIEAVWRLA